jgi:tetratricopeptide (TPR) repeat protein
MPVRHCWQLIGVVCVLTAGASPGAAQDAAARARQAYAQAIALEDNGNYTAALALLWEAAALSPADPDVQNRLGEALERMGALDAAADAYKRAVAERPGFLKATNNLVLLLVKAGKADEAVQRARALVAEAPDDPERHLTLGLAQSEQDAAEAIASFRRVLQLNPRHTLAHYNLALVLKRADRFPEAIDALHRAIAIDPRPEAHYTLGVIYWQQGELDRAVAALRSAVDAQPRYAEAHYTLGAVLAGKRDWDGAIQSLRRAIALRPDLWSARSTLARVLQSAGQESAAREELAESERLRWRAQLEQEAAVLTAVGTQKLGDGDPSGALTLFRRATALLDNYAPAHYQAGVALQKLGQLDASRAAFARAAQLNPGLVPPVPGVPR